MHAPGLYVCGLPGSGKTLICKRLVQSHPVPSVVVACAEYANIGQVKSVCCMYSIWFRDVMLFYCPTMFCLLVACAWCVGCGGSPSCVGDIQCCPRPCCSPVKGRYACEGCCRRHTGNDTGIHQCKCQGRCT